MYRIGTRPTNKSLVTAVKMVNLSSSGTRETVARAPDMEPFIADLLERRVARRDRPPYTLISTEEVRSRLERFFQTRLAGSRVTNVARLGGGGSKEQFRFDLENAGEDSGAYVLRMDSFESVVETSREREFEVIHKMRGIVPLPRAAWLDVDGAELGRPSIIMSFECGAIKPNTAPPANISGIGIAFDADWRARLAPRFIDLLRQVHAMDWRGAAFKTLQAPISDPMQAARWQVEWWARVWRDDKVSSSPIALLTEQWMRDNLPPCHEVVMVHGDFRSGNYLLDSDTAEITALLDWELSHLGDHHEDLAWILQTATNENGQRYFSGLLTRDELIFQYERATGRAVDLRTLHFYEVLSAYKCLVIIWATGPRVARLQYSHQDIMLTWMAGIGHKYHSELCRLLEREFAA